MPTYDYECSECGHVFELLHGMRDDPDPPCPQCGAGSQRLISGGAGVVFKGSGFHATDNGNSRNPSCGQNRTCCGRDEPCEVPPCEG
jgi:putative FmdB family regulatory protein